jgi:glutamyl-tRNA reductase
MSRPGSAGTLVVAGLSHHTAPVAVRERLAAAFAADGDGHVRAAVREACGPAVVLATCNRLEVYCWVDGRAAARLVGTLARVAGLPPREVRPYAYAHTRLEAVRHLIRVASGLDSLALGETQIIGQVRDAFLAAAGEAPLGPEMHLVFQHALESARRVRQLGAFDRHPSVAAIAVHVAGAEIGGVRGRDVAVLGAGVTGKAAARTLAARGAGRIRLLNRSADRAAELANALALGERVVPGGLDDLPAALAGCDAIVCATAAPRPVVTAAAVEAALQERTRRGPGSSPERRAGGAQEHSAPSTGGPLAGGAALVLVDIAVPRDVEPAVRALPGVILLDLDDLEARCALDAEARLSEVQRVEAAARAEAEACLAALRARTAAPHIVALRRRADAIREAELRRFAGRLGDLDPAQQAAVEQMTHAIVQKLLHPPTVALRSATRRTRTTLLEALGGAGAVPDEGDLT